MHPSVGWLYILGLIAQCERESGSERTRDAMTHLKQQGVAMGGVPYGFSYSAVRDEAGRKPLVEVPEQVSVIARILELFDVGTSASRLAALLNEEGIAAPQGDVWYTNIVRRLSCPSL